MATGSNGLGTTQTSFQIGKGGPRIDASVPLLPAIKSAAGVLIPWECASVEIVDAPTGLGGRVRLTYSSPLAADFTQLFQGVSGTVALIADINVADSVTNAVLANMATQTMKGRTTAGAGDPEDLTAAQARAVLGITDGGWVAPTLVNSWVNFGAPVAVAGYRKVGSLVTLRGGIKSGTFIDSTTIFTLPATFRPTADRQSVCAGQSSSKYNLSIDSLGVVRIFGVTGNTIIFLDGVSFHID